MASSELREQDMARGNKQRRTPRGGRKGNETHVLYDLAPPGISSNAYLLHVARNGLKYSKSRKQTLTSRWALRPSAKVPSQDKQEETSSFKYFRSPTISPDAKLQYSSALYKGET